MHPLLKPTASAGAVPIHVVNAATIDAVTAGLTSAQRAYLAATGYEPKPGKVALLTDAAGTLSVVLFGIEAEGARHADPLLAGRLPAQLPPGLYRFAGRLADAERAAFAFLAAQYRFDRYKQAPAREVLLALPEGVDGDSLTRAIEATFLARDLVNTPANDLGPAELEAAIRELAGRHGAEVSATVGADLLAAGLPMIHAVGMGSARPPRLVDLTWGDPAHAKVTLVGKGVCFDTGGLDIKSDAGMLLMKKDMGGAAAAIGLAHMIMAAKLPVRLRLLVPAVENAVSGTAFRPGDVFPTRKGLSVEIGNTDAEGRLVLCDALALADEEAPALIADFATLTGAARVALGPDLPPIYSHDDALAAELVAAGARVADPLWRLPLWAPYATGLESRVADLNNVATGGFAGSITAALYLDRFVEKAKAWIHADIYAWVPTERPGRPAGGEFQAGRALFEVIKARFAG
ncbi:leucyl aminopeptidase family protein [Phreatobacter sp. AB_2022a]|uniref:leucyl aminopeptidase family protein n=1 Tax=Phreatobacter sp. AB_2022a TaxID=3003134 RepID=UPI0022875E4D|nr:leucyl aminopeptidase family protein [Phreatobacter sp. AB_2022a]MCZ0736219.1 leucyl aminopeptidase family protein [Phreatobacter sp. AB_2022a]